MNMMNLQQVEQLQPAQQSAPVSKEDFCNGMRNLAGHCVVIAANDGQCRAGLTATAVCSVTAEPPRLLVCVNRDVFAHGVITRSGRLSINVLGASQEPVARRFAGMIPGVSGGERFVDDDWEEGRNGTPILARALASFDCSVVEIIPAATHDLFLCEVQDVKGTLDQAEPLLYFAGKFSAIPRHNH